MCRVGLIHASSRMDFASREYIYNYVVRHVYDGGIQSDMATSWVSQYVLDFWRKFRVSKDDETR